MHKASEMHSLPVVHRNHMVREPGETKLGSTHKLMASIECLSKVGSQVDNVAYKLLKQSSIRYLMLENMVLLLTFCWS